MLIKGLVDEDFVNYKVPSMFVSTNTCTFKCDTECGSTVCQNGTLARQPSVDIPVDSMALRYLGNAITDAVVFGGLEPFDQFDDILEFVISLRKKYRCCDTVVIYTGYNCDEIAKKIAALKNFVNIIVKFGRYKPGDKPHYDDVLGVYLASDNQFALKIS